MLCLFPAVPGYFLIFTHVFLNPNHTELRMVSLDTGTPYIDVQLPIDLHSTEAIFVSYDYVQHKVGGHYLEESCRNIGGHYLESPRF